MIKFKIINKILLLTLTLSLSTTMILASNSSGNSGGKSSGNSGGKSSGNSGGKSSGNSGGKSSGNNDTKNCSKYKSLRNKYSLNSQKYDYYTNKYIAKCTNLNIEDSSVLEGDNNTSDLIFKVSLTHDAIEEVTFSYTVEEETATENEDYILESTLTATIPKGSRSTNIIIEVNGDTKIEAAETLIVHIKQAHNAVLDDSKEEDTSSSGKESSGNKSSGNKSSGNKSSGNKSSGNKSSGNKSSGNKSSGNKSSGNKSSGNKSSGNKSSGNKSSGNKSSGNKSSGNKSSGNKSSGNSGNSSSNDEPKKRGISATGTIINDDYLINFNIERTNSDIQDNATQQQKESLYTQVVGRDFNYAIVVYDNNNQPYDINNTTIKVDLISNNKSIYTNYYYTGLNKQNRFNITDDTDLKIEKALKNAKFTISLIADINGSIVYGNYPTKTAYNLKKTLTEYHEKTQDSRDSFSIRPATYTILISDKDTNNNTIPYRINNQTYPTRLNLAAEHDYTLKVNATQYASEKIATNYSQNVTDELNISLIFDDNLSCNNTNNIKLPYKFNNGTFTQTLEHNNYGKYKLNITDNNWTAVDMNSNENLSGCIKDSSIISNTPNEKSGCNISSNFDDIHQDMTLRFNPVRFDVNSSLSNVHGGTKPYLYMSDLSLSDKMGVNIYSTIKAVGEKGTVLANFTQGCIDKTVILPMGLNFSFISDAGESNNTHFIQPTSIKGKPLFPQQIVNFNGDTNASMQIMQNLDLSQKFLKNNHGTMTMNSLYNMQKLFDEPTNPIKVSFLAMSLQSTDLDIQVGNSNKEVNGKGNLNETRTFYFSRISSYLPNYPETNKKSIRTPLFVEIFCRTKTPTQDWCRDASGMNLDAIGNIIGHKTYNGWYLATEHNEDREGKVYALSSNNSDIQIKLSNIGNNTYDENNPLEPNNTSEGEAPTLENNTGTIENPALSFNGGKIDNLYTYYNSQDKLVGELSAIITLDTDVWLRFKDNQYSVKIKNVSGLVGISMANDGNNTGFGANLLQDGKGNFQGMIQHNGKMSW